MCESSMYVIGEIFDAIWQRDSILIPYPVKKIKIEANFLSLNQSSNIQMQINSQQPSIIQQNQTCSAGLLISYNLQYSIEVTNPNKVEFLSEFKNQIYFQRLRIYVTPIDGQSQCHYSCQQCQNDQPNICTSCYSDRTLSVQGNCNCNSGIDVYFYSECNQQQSNPGCSNLTCLICNPSLDSLNCSKCDPQLNRILNNLNKTCDCMDGYYDKQGFISCKKCSQNCLTCLGLDSTCVSCDAKKLRQLNNQTNKCDCLQGYFSLSDSDVCQKCSDNCLTCQFAENQCTSCKDGYFLNNANQCQQCIQPCLNCIDQNKCTSCVKGDKFVYNNTNNSCQCQDGYYLDQSTCKYCPLTCSKCNSSSQCTECVQGTSLQSNGTCQCSSGQIFNTSINQCQSCQPDEIICLDKNNQNQPKCASGDQYKANSITQICECNNGYYQDGLRCIKCPVECSECSSNLLCTKCTDIKANLKEGKCSCLTGQFFDLTQNKCIGCINNCSVCQDTTTCQICIDEQKYQLDQTTRTCVCKDGFYMENSKCENCDDECLTCSSKTICQKCNNNSKNPGEGACRCSKGFAYDFNNKICKQCKQGCSVCNQNQECNQCVNDPAYHLVYNECICSEGYYLDPVSSTCLKCSPMCKTCSNAQTCIECLYTDQTKIFDEQPGVCSCIKENSFFDMNDKICKPCQKTCKKCVSNTICLECINNTEFKLENNQCICNDGYFLYELSMQCLLNCGDKYFIQDKCVDKCPPELKIVNNKSCENECPQNFIAINQYCTRTYCDQNCINCDRDQIHCIKCSQDYKLMKDTSCKQCDKVKQFYDEVSYSCQNCDSSCNSCKGKTSSDCINCAFAKNPYKNNICVLECDRFQVGKKNQKTQLIECTYCYKLDGNCLDKCPLGYFFDTQFNCIKCHSSCLECSGPSEQDCISCQGKDYLQYSGQCTACPYQMFMNKNTNSCSLCHYSCISCSGSTSQDCTQCESSLKLSSISKQCISSSDFQKEQAELEKQQQFQCLSEDYFQCKEDILRAKQIKSLQNVIAATSIGSALFVSLFIPEVKLITWQHVQNMQCIGDILQLSDAFPQFFQDYYLQLNRYYNIIPIIYDSKQPNNNTVSENQQNLKINATSNYNLEYGNNKQQQQLNQKARRLFLFFDEKSQLFYSRCFIQLAIIYISLLLIPIMYIIEQKSKVIQKIYTYFKWNFIINIFMAFSNEIISNMLISSQYINFSQKQEIIDFFAIINTALIYIAFQISILVFLLSIRCLQSGILRQSYKVILKFINEESVMQRLFYPIYEIKKLSIILTIHMLQSKPNIILYIFVSLNCLFILYLVIAKPFKSNFQQISIIFIELLNNLKILLMILIYNFRLNSSFYNVFFYAQTCTELVLPFFCILIMLLKICSYFQEKRQNQIKKDQDSTKFISGIKLDIDISLILNQSTLQKKQLIKIKTKQKMCIQEMEKV
ncbi:hypothetical protein ABPG72_009972 [Tetrahymena utriculariae]